MHFQRFIHEATDQWQSWSGSTIIGKLWCVNVLELSYCMDPPAVGIMFSWTFTTTSGIYGTCRIYCLYRSKWQDWTNPISSCLQILPTYNNSKSGYTPCTKHVRKRPLTFTPCGKIIRKVFKSWSVDVHSCLCDRPMRLFHLTMLMTSTLLTKTRLLCIHLVERETIVALPFFRGNPIEQAISAVNSLGIRLLPCDRCDRKLDIFHDLLVWNAMSLSWTWCYIKCPIFTYNLQSRFQSFHLVDRSPISIVSDCLFQSIPWFFF